MFVVSLKARTLRAAGILLALAAVAAAAGWEGRAVQNIGPPAASAAASGTASAAERQAADASTNAGRIAFLRGFGWEVSDQPVEVAEVVIPQQWGAVYTRYNALQKLQGYDLAAYRGRRVKRWTYEVKNYPGTAQAGVRANVLVLGRRVIGGDVSSVALDGFMQGFSREAPVRTGATPAQADLVQATFSAGGKVT